MKLRLYENSIRFRLSPDDVATLESTGHITARTQFSVTISFYYELRTSTVVTTPRAEFFTDRLVVSLPLSTANRWAKTDEVGIESDQPIDASTSLHILIEKDFECLDEPSTDAGVKLFPNPKQTCAPQR